MRSWEGQKWATNNWDEEARAIFTLIVSGGSDEDVVQKLLEVFPDLTDANAFAQTETYLHHRWGRQGAPYIWWATRKGLYSSVRLLLDAKADLHDCDDWFGRQNCFEAASLNHPLVLKLLLDNNADPNTIPWSRPPHAKAETPLQMALRKGDREDVVQILPDAGASEDDTVADARKSTKGTNRYLGKPKWKPAPNNYRGAPYGGFGVHKSLL